jgi:hypothetical protein
MSNQPKRKSQPRVKKISVPGKDHWRKIIRDVDKESVPIDLLLSITVRLIDGSEVKIDIQELLESGNDPESLEKMLAFKLEAIENFIKDVDYYVSVDQVVKTVQPLTDQILKDL